MTPCVCIHPAIAHLIYQNLRLCVLSVHEWERWETMTSLFSVHSHFIVSFLWIFHIIFFCLPFFSSFFFIINIVRFVFHLVHFPFAYLIFHAKQNIYDFFDIRSSFVTINFSYIFVDKFIAFYGVGDANRNSKSILLTNERKYARNQIESFNKALFSRVAIYSWYVTGTQGKKNCVVRLWKCADNTKFNDAIPVCSTGVTETRKKSQQKLSTNLLKNKGKFARATIFLSLFCPNKRKIVHRCVGDTKRMRTRLTSQEMIKKAERIKSNLKVLYIFNDGMRKTPTMPNGKLEIT